MILRNCKICNQLFRKMSTTHLERTKDILRDPKRFSNATVDKIVSISPTVKFMQLKVDSKELIFKPGQWVDFYAPGVTTVGGFSMCSSPSLLKTESIMDLAVKYSEHPPAHWVHSKCVAGSRVGLHVGGNFSYEMNQENLADNLLFIAAGVGINPLLSMMKNVFECHKNYPGDPFGKVSLYYTATTYEELLFKDDISHMKSTDQSFDIHYFVTKQPSETLPEFVNAHRINESNLLNAVKNMSVEPSKVISYLCAPPEMMYEMERLLLQIGLLKENIRYESWW